MQVAIPVESLPGWKGWTFTVTPGDDQTRETVTVQAPLGAKVDAAKWRTLPIGRVLSIAHKVRKAPMAALLVEKVPAVKRPHGGSAAHRHAVRDVYRIAISQGVSPAELIREHWQLSNHKTASEWIKQCREAGVLASYREEVQLAEANRYAPYPRADAEEKPPRPLSAEDVAALSELMHGRNTGRSRGRGSTVVTNTNTNTNTKDN